MKHWQPLLIGLLLTYLASPWSVVSQQKPGPRGPSTPEERAAVIDLAKKLQENPLDKGLQEQERQLHSMLVHAPDMNVSSCYDEAPWFTSDHRYSQELVGAYLMSNAAFVISHPGQPDLKAAHMAGLQGAIGAYQAIVTQDPKARWKKMEQLVASYNKGELQKKSTSFCAAPLPLKAFAAIK